MTGMTDCPRTVHPFNEETTMTRLHQHLGSAFREFERPSASRMRERTRFILVALVLSQLAGAAAVFAVGEAHAHHPEIPIISLR